MQGVAEVFFLYISASALHDDYDNVCNDTHFNYYFDIESLRLALQMMMSLHILHILRLIYKLLDKLRRNRK